MKRLLVVSFILLLCISLATAGYYSTIIDVEESSFFARESVNSINSTVNVKQHITPINYYDDNDDTYFNSAVLTTEGLITSTYAEFTVYYSGNSTSTELFTGVRFDDGSPGMNTDLHYGIHFSENDEGSVKFETEWNY